jgi:Lar family restriction alleviation protein
MQINRCPKCGREPVILITRNNDESESIYGYRAECYDCDIWADIGNTKAEAVTKWNELTKGETK